MSSHYEYDAYDSRIAAHAGVDARTTFIRRTYAHLAGAILAFVALEAVLQSWFQRWILEPANRETVGRFFGNGIGMLVVFGGFMAVSWLAQVWARSSASRALQYAGLGLYVLAEAVIFIPILYIADTAPAFDGQHIIPTAGILTLTIFGGLTLGVFVTGKDFSFLGPILCICSLGAIGFIIAGMIFGFNLGLIFSFAMVALMSGYILYYTSNVIHHYSTEQYVAAALVLFASIATLFWYVLRILMSMNRR